MQEVRSNRSGITPAVPENLNDPPRHPRAPAAPPRHPRAPRCQTCSRAMRARMLIPGEREDQVTYRCERCRAEVICTMAR
jgi:hypothetical protein